MRGHLGTEPADDIGFLLIRRPLPDGKVAVVLHLYRDDKPALTTTVATVSASVARMVALACRLRLLERGASEHSPTLPRAATLAPVPQAA